jgi:hypothetical protein
MRRGNTAYVIVGWMIVALGAFHTLRTPFAFAEFATPALWYASGGGAFTMVGLINLVNAQRSDELPALGKLALGVNLATIGFQLMVLVAEPSAIGVIVGVLVATAATFFSATGLRHEVRATA